MGYSPRHALTLLPGWAKIAIPAAVSLALAGGGAVLAAGAGASVSPTVTYTTAGTNGVAGYYAAPNAFRTANGDHVNGVRAEFVLSDNAEYGSGAAKIGVELCEYKALSGVGGVATVFAEWNPAPAASGGQVFDIYANHIATTDCLNGMANTAGATLIDTVPAGHLLFLAITVSQHHVVTFTDSDETTQTGGASTFGGFTFGFNRAGIGTDADTATLTTPATLPLAVFQATSVRDTAKGWVTINRKGLTRLVLNEVASSTDATPSGDLLVPAGLTADGFTLNMGQQSS